MADGNHDHAAAIGKLQGTVEHLSKDLDHGRARINEIAELGHRVETRLQTLVETATPQRTQMLTDLAEIKIATAKLPDLITRVDKHGKLLDDHEAFKNKSLGIIGIVGGAAGFAVTALFNFGKYLWGVK